MKKLATEVSAEEGGGKESGSNEPVPRKTSSRLRGSATSCRVVQTCSAGSQQWGVQRGHSYQALCWALLAAEHHRPGIASGKGRNHVLFSSLKPSQDEKNAIEVELSYEIRKWAHVLVKLGYFEKNQPVQKQMSSQSLAIWNFPLLIYRFCLFSNGNAMEVCRNEWRGLVCHKHEVTCTYVAFFQSLPYTSWWTDNLAPLWRVRPIQSNCILQDKMFAQAKCKYI